MLPAVSSQPQLQQACKLRHACAGYGACQTIARIKSALSWLGVVGTVHCLRWPLAADRELSDDLLLIKTMSTNLHQKSGWDRQARRPGYQTRRTPIAWSCKYADWKDPQYVWFNQFEPDRYI